MRGGFRDSTPTRGGLAGEFRAHIDYMFDVTIEGTPRRRALRSSSLPYCPVLDVLDPREPERADLEGALYMSIGTAAHTALQVFATVGAPGARAWGCWRCPRCAHEWREQFRPDACPSGCNDSPLYVEVSYRLAIATGHSDMLVRYPHGWVLHEYKTCGRHPRQPYGRHLLQARTYCHMLRRQFGISASYGIVYIERAHLARRVFGPYDARPSLQWIGDVTERGIVGFRAASACRRRPDRDNLLEVARLRPCVDRDSYHEYMGRSMSFVKKPCEMLDTCSTTTIAVARMMREIAG